MTELRSRAGSGAASLCAAAALILALGSAGPALAQQPQRRLVEPGTIEMDANGVCTLAPPQVAALDLTPAPDLQVVACRVSLNPNTPIAWPVEPRTTPWIVAYVAEPAMCGGWHEGGQGPPIQLQALQLDPALTYAVTLEVLWHRSDTGAVLHQATLSLGTLGVGGLQPEALPPSTLPPGPAHPSPIPPGQPGPVPAPRGR